jgi:hypothetical protein
MCFVLCFLHSSFHSLSFFVDFDCSSFVPGCSRKSAIGNAVSRRFAASQTGREGNESFSSSFFCCSFSLHHRSERRKRLPRRLRRRRRRCKIRRRRKRSTRYKQTQSFCFSFLIFFLSSLSFQSLLPPLEGAPSSLPLEGQLRKAGLIDLLAPLNVYGIESCADVHAMQPDDIEVPEEEKEKERKSWRRKNKNDEVEEKRKRKKRSRDIERR